MVVEQTKTQYGENGEMAMKSAITDGKGNLWIEKLPIPEPSEYQALCKVHACASCTGTDRKASGRTGEDIAHQYMLDAVHLGLVDLSN